MYLHQNPYLAWEFTKKREKLEGRTVPKDVFINAYFSAKKNVQTVKKKYGEIVKLHLFEKDQDNNFIKETRFNIQSIDQFIKETYTVAELEKLLPNKV